jgi:hypothetical protein
MISPKAPKQYGLKERTLPRIRVEWGEIIVRLEVASRQDPDDVRDVEILFPPRLAIEIGEELMNAGQKLA